VQERNELALGLPLLLPGKKITSLAMQIDEALHAPESHRVIVPIHELPKTHSGVAFSTKDTAPNSNLNFISVRF